MDRPNPNAEAQNEPPGIIARIGSIIFQMIMVQTVMQMAGSMFSGNQPAKPDMQLPAGSNNISLVNGLNPDSDFDAFMHFRIVTNDTIPEPFVETVETQPSWNMLSLVKSQLPKDSRSIPLSVQTSGNAYGVFSLQELTKSPIASDTNVDLSIVKVIPFLNQKYIYNRWTASKEESFDIRLPKSLLDSDNYLLILITTIVPFHAYSVDRKQLLTESDVLSALSNVDENKIFQRASNLIVNIPPFNVKEEAHSLLGDVVTTDSSEVDTSPMRHLLNRIDVNLVHDTSIYTPQTLSVGPMRSIRKRVDFGYYEPMIDNSDFWLLEKNFVPLNETLIDTPIPWTISFGISSLHGWLIQQQLTTSLEQQQQFSVQSVREGLMFKRILVETNPFMLVFSACFILLHSVFSFFAFKNDMQFWYSNESMEGLSALSVVSSFICELIIGLYLFDSQETSWLILFEVVLGVALSAWKLTKALKCQRISHFPFISIEFQKSYEKSNTSNYDSVAIKYMSIALAPCITAYAVYSLLYNKHKSWYSYVLSVLAGSVYTFGFVLMTPQLYINYKLKSVDHLPWRALIYKSLNTFVDDVASFLIDMPWMHRLSCFRDDIIFICYLYQRWIYKVDINRRSHGEVAQPIIEDNNIATPEVSENIQDSESTEVSKNTEVSESTQVSQDTQVCEDTQGIRQRQRANRESSST